MASYICVPNGTLLYHIWSLFGSRLGNILKMCRRTISYTLGDFPGKFFYTQQARSEVDEQNISLHRQVCLIVATRWNLSRQIALCALAIGSGMALRWGHDIICISLPSWECFSISPENKTCCSCRVIISTGRSACWESNVSGVFAQSLGLPTPLHTVLKKQMHWRTERLKLRATATSPNLVQKVKRLLCRVFSYRWLVYFSKTLCIEYCYRQEHTKRD